LIKIAVFIALVSGASAYAEDLGESPWPEHPLFSAVRAAPAVPCSSDSLPFLGVTGGYGPRSAWQTNLWPGGIVHYQIDAAVTQVNRDRLRIAMDELQTFANVTFVPRTTQTAHIYVQNSTVNNSFVGRIGGSQIVNLFNFDYRYIIIHELMHALGTWHEQNRSDRDTFVTINLANVCQTCCGGSCNFAFNVQAVAVPVGTYDFQSIMHYDQYAFSTNGQPTIQAKPAYAAFQSQMGNLSFMSVGDKSGIVSRYGAPVDDVFEPNNTQPTAAVLLANSTTTLKLLDDDLFIVPATTVASSRVNISATAPGVWAPFNARLQLLNAAGSVLTTSNFIASGTNAAASIAGTFSGGPLVVRVSRTQPWGGTYTLTTTSSLATFNGINGAKPYSGLTLSGNTLYGTTYQGGTSNSSFPNGMGTVFAVPATGGLPTTLVSFNTTNGANPAAGLTLSGNILYGTTQKGGSSNLGTVFSIPVTGGTPTTLVSFNGANGAEPYAGLIQLGNILFGTTQAGGTNNLGTVFSVSLTGGQVTTLASFNRTNGANPRSRMILSGNSLYGTTQYGGASGNSGLGWGTVFSVPISGGPVSTLVTFNGANGAIPQSGLTLSGNTLYGTTSGGGANNLGTVFAVPVTGGTITTLTTFSGANGANPIAGLTFLGSTLYGTTINGGPGNLGTVFAVSFTGGTPITLATFNSINGSKPLAGLTLSGNTLYGTTRDGGNSNNGTIFALAIPCTALSILSHPATAASCPSSAATFSVAASGTTPAYQWQWQPAGPSTAWAALTNGINTNNQATPTFNVSGAATPTVNISSISGVGGNFRCIVTNACGSVTSNVATLTVLNPSDPACIICPTCSADYNQDGGVTGDDVAAFFNDYEAGTGCADTNVDGGITGDDIAAFFVAFEAGGC